LNGTIATVFAAAVAGGGDSGNIMAVAMIRKEKSLRMGDAVIKIWPPGLETRFQKSRLEAAPTINTSRLEAAPAGKLS
jgi:hypothetical protein